MTVSSALPRHVADGFRHEAVVYRGLDSMVGLVLPFVVEGVDRGESVLVAMPLDRIEALRAALGARAHLVSFLDMSESGGNPARIIPAWRAFLDEHAGESSVRGVGEPVWLGRRPVEIDECRLHESLLNFAFSSGPRWQLLCPYDAEALPADVVADAVRRHPTNTLSSVSDYHGHTHAIGEFASPLPRPSAHVVSVPFLGADLYALRRVVRGLCEEAGLTDDAAGDLVLAAHELATNSVIHGGGEGTLRSWSDLEALVLEISDAGVIANPLVGRELESEFSEGGRGVWMANQLCDLVQVRSSETGTTIRLHAWL